MSATLSFDEVFGIVSAAKDSCFDVHWERFRSDPAFRERLVALANQGAFVDLEFSNRPYRDFPQLAVFGVAEWAGTFGEELLSSDIEKAQDFPWLEALKEPCPSDPDKKVADTHFAFFVPWFLPSRSGVFQRINTTFAEIRARLPRPGHPRLLGASFPLGKGTILGGWRLMPLSGLQEHIDTSGYRPTSVAEFLLGNLLYCQRYGQGPLWINGSTARCGDWLVERFPNELRVVDRGSVDWRALAMTRDPQSTT